MKRLTLLLFVVVAVVFTASSQTYLPKRVKEWGFTTSVSYNPIFFKGIDYDMHGVAVDFMAEKLLYAPASLYLDFGARATYVSDSYKSSVGKSKASMITLAIPVNLRYSFDIDDSGFSLMPFVGLGLRVNALAKEDIDANGTTYSYNFFSDSDMSKAGMDTWDRVQLAYQSGLAVAYEGVRFTLWYGEEINDITQGVETSQLGIALGVTF